MKITPLHVVDPLQEVLCKSVVRETRAEKHVATRPDTVAEELRDYTAAEGQTSGMLQWCRFAVAGVLGYRNNITWRNGCRPLRR